MTNLLRRRRLSEYRIQEYGLSLLHVYGHRSALSDLVDQVSFPSEIEFLKLRSEGPPPGSNLDSVFQCREKAKGRSTKESARSLPSQCFDLVGSRA